MRPPQAPNEGRLGRTTIGAWNKVSLNSLLWDELGRIGKRWQRMRIPGPRGGQPRR